MVFSARMIDRVGKGIRGAPRDALVADVTPPEIRGAAYGLRRALDTVGAFLGPLLAVLLMFIWANDFSRYLLGGGHSRRTIHCSTGLLACRSRNPPSRTNVAIR